MKKVICQILILTLLCSCAMKKHQVPTAAFDTDTKSVVPAKSIALEKGKICYIYTTQYEGLLPGPELLTPKSESSFLPQMLGNSAFMGGGSSSAKVDTAVNNDLLVQTALQEVIKNRAPGFQFQFVPQEEFTDSMCNLPLTSYTQN